MFEITERAARELKDTLERKDVAMGSCFGLSMNQEEGYELFIRPASPRKSSDRVFLFDGRKVLVVDGETASKLKEIKLDTRKTEEGETRLTLFSSP